MRLRALLALAVAVPLLALVAACGGGGGDETTTAEPATTAAATTEAATTEAATTAEAGGETVAADQWASSVCGALTDWQTSITSTTPPDITDTSDLEGTKQQVSDFLDSVVGSTDTLVSDVQAAGVPDVDQGDAIATDFQNALVSVRDSFQQAKSDVDSLSTDDSAGFAAKLTEIGTTLTQAGTDASAAISKISTDYPDSGIDQAFNSASECSALTGSTSAATTG